MTARQLIADRPDSQWLVFDTSAERDAAQRDMLRSWVTLADRSVLLNYSQTFADAQGPALHIAHAPAHGTSGYTQTTARSVSIPARQWCAHNNCPRPPVNIGARLLLCVHHGGGS